MNRTTILIIILTFIITSCEEKEETSSPDYFFNSVVDSSFYCEVNIEEEKHIFNTHVSSLNSHSTSFDSILFEFKFCFVNNRDSRIGEFTIQFDKTFALSELENFYLSEDRYVFVNCLEQHEFLSIFQEENLKFIVRDTEDEHKFLDGVSIVFNGYGDTLWKTDYASKYLDADSLDNFYSDANFTIINLEILDANTIIIECSFNLEIFGWRSISYRKNFSNGYFKGYYKNPYTSCR